LYERILDEDEFVPYWLIEEKGIAYSCCETMVSENEELVPAFYIDATHKLRGSESLYEHYINVCCELGIPDARIKVNKMLVCDYILGKNSTYIRQW